MCDAGEKRVNGTSITDATCETCSSGQYQPNTKSNSSNCQPWSNCPVGYGLIAGSNTKTTNTRCEECMAEDKNFSMMNDLSTCQQHKTCGPGFGLKLAGTNKPETQCESCVASFSNDSNYETCTPWLPCLAGEKRVNGTSTEDATCVTCSSGQYQPNNNSVVSRCQPWSRCSTIEYIVNGTNIEDSKCYNCSAISNEYSAKCIRSCGLYCNEIKLWYNTKCNCLK